MTAKNFQEVAFSLIIIAVLLSACNKKPESIGLDLVDDNKTVPGFDTTLNVYAYSEVEDSVVSDETSINMLGSMQTATFGRVTTSFYTHLRLSFDSPDFGPNPQADSMILTFVYDGYYGNINTPQTVTVHRVTDTIFQDRSYYSNDSIAYDPNVIGSLTGFIPNPEDSVYIDTVKVAPALQISLNVDTVQHIFFDHPSATFESSTAFINYFKGLYIKAETVNGIGEGAVLYLDLLNERSMATLYYHNDTLDSLSYSFLINENNARVGRYQHNYTLSTDPVFTQQVINPDPDTTMVGKESLYLQGLGGIQTKIKFPELISWAQTTGLIINEARLVITARDYQDMYAPPDNLLLFTFDEEGKLTVTRDQIDFGEDYYGGSFKESTETYTFRITRYLQGLINGNPDRGLILYPNGKAVRANQLTFYGTEQSNPYHLKVKIIYTEAD